MPKKTKNPLTSKKIIPLETILKHKLDGKTNLEIAGLLNCTHQNVTQRLQRHRINTQEIEIYKKNRADVLAELQHKILSTLTEADLKKASLQQKLTGFGILYDKERLERGQSTSNLSLHAMIVEEACKGKKTARGDSPGRANGGK